MVAIGKGGARRRGEGERKGSMFIPIRTDRRMRHTPYMTYLIILLSVVAFFVQMAVEAKRGEAAVLPFMLRPTDLHWYQFFTYVFMHGDPWHIAGNMLFLYVFGCNIEDRLGPIGFAAFYLAGGVIAGLGHCLVEPTNVIGASGAVAAVTGMFLALLPQTRITMLIVFFFIMFYEIPSMYLILLSFAWDVFNQFGLGGGGVAYLAHISGNVFGFVVGMLLLWTRILPREAYDFLALMDRWNRRRVMRDLASKGYSPWERDGAAARGGKGAKVSPEEEAIMEARHGVSAALEGRNLDGALEAYEKLMRLDSEQVLHRQAQLDVANHAMAAGHHRTAAGAYEKFIETYGNDSFADEVRLILGLAYLRYLGDREKARKYLKEAAERLSDEGRKGLATQLLGEAGG